MFCQKAHNTESRFSQQPPALVSEVAAGDSQLLGFVVALLRAAAAERGCSAILRAPRAKSKSRRDDMIIAPGNPAPREPPRVTRPAKKISLFPVLPRKRSGQNRKKGDWGLGTFSQGGAPASARSFGAAGVPRLPRAIIGLPFQGGR